MKQIYSRLAKERKPEFQIETAIFQMDDGKKVVIKKPLTCQAEPHVRRMVENYKNFSEEIKSYYVPCWWKNDGVLFPFVNGESLYKRLINAVSDKNKKKILDIISEYAHIVDLLAGEQSLFQPSEEFEKIFGNVKVNENIMSARNINIDLSFDNIIIDNDTIRIIDYEWIMDALIPVKFCVYRAIFAFYVKHHHMLENVVDEDELYHAGGIKQEEKETYGIMDKAFVNYVDGGKFSYHNMLTAYVQPEIKGAKNEMLEFAQVYWGSEGAFTAERVKNYSVGEGQLVKIEVDIDEYPGTDAIRIDPTNEGSYIKIFSFKVITLDGERELYKDDIAFKNITIYDTTCILDDQDPQFVIPVRHGWKKLILEYKVLSALNDTIENMAEAFKNDSRSQNQSWQEKNKEYIERYEQLLAESIQFRKEHDDCMNHNELQERTYQHEIQLLRDKLAYIEGTKAYKQFLKGKVDKIHLWDDINK